MAVPLIPIAVGLGSGIIGWFAGGGSGGSGQGGEKAPSLKGGLLEIGTKKDLTTEYINTQTTTTTTDVYSPTISNTETFAPQYNFQYIIDSAGASATQSPRLIPTQTTTQTPSISTPTQIIPMQDIMQNPRTSTESTFSSLFPYLLIGGAVYFLFFYKGGKK